MYFWRIDNLKADLKAGPLPQKQQLHYALAWAVITGVITIPISEGSALALVLGLITIAIAVGGTLYLYHCNGGSNGTRFLERYFSIAFVVTVRFLVLVVLPMALAFISVVLYLEEAPEGTTIEEIVVVSALSVVWYWRVGVHTQQVARHRVA